MIQPQVAKDANQHMDEGLEIDESNLIQINLEL